jgi:hypothetical protein
VLRAETLRWFAEQTNRTVEQVERDVKRVSAEVPLRDRVLFVGPTIDLHTALRTMAPWGEGAGQVRRVGRAKLTLVVSLPNLRVWVARGDEWDRALRRSPSGDGCPVRYQLLGRRGPWVADEAPQWYDVTPSEVPGELDEQVGRIVWASRMQSDAA